MINIIYGRHWKVQCRSHLKLGRFYTPGIKFTGLSDRVGWEASTLLMIYALKAASVL
jgi:hypothetical protein